MNSDLIVITGATRGCGRALVDRFVEGGHTVAGVGRTSILVEELRQRHPAPHDFQRVDVGDDEAVGLWARRVLERYGPPRLLINNAGLINQSRELWRVPPEEFAAVLAVNLQGAYHVIRHFLPAMIDAGTGVVVNISSGWGRSTSPQVAPYCASKWGLEGLTRSLAQELPQGLAAVSVNPGIIRTEMLASCFGVEADRYPSPQDWSRGAARLLLKLGAEDNGQALTVS